MTKQLKPVNAHLDSVTISDVETHKNITTKELQRDLANLNKFKADANENNFAGNPFLYHFQFKNLLNCRRQDGKTIYDIYAEPTAWQKLIDSTRQRNRGGRTAAGNVFECFRINLGSVVMFKSTTAKYLYKKYNATSVLDPTAGWGGRMLGAWSLGIDYTGIDTNENLAEPYENMMNELPVGDSDILDFRVANCLDVDFSQIDYDFVLTSPPYVNLEVYEHMTPYESDKAFYTKFLIPLLNKCLAHIKNNGYVCFNISPKMYEALLSHGFRAADTQLDLLQQKRLGKDKEDKIYGWRNPV
jgi:2-polyprenyl-3-methyl-5-hydroxy-6-metoxy-1,4-benzoquinol methylase